MTSDPATMVPQEYTAARFHEYALPEKEGCIKLEQVPSPDKIPDDGVLLRVEYSAVNPIDYKYLSGGMKSIVRNKLPSYLGHDVSGVVVRTGRHSRFKVGEGAFGGNLVQQMSTVGGSMAEYVVVHDKNLCLKPEGLSHRDAVGLNVAGLTAFYGLVDCLKVQAGEVVLINGASGGVGCYAVQVAKALGASVIGTCSDRNSGFVKDTLGADETVNYNITTPLEAVTRYKPTKILDLVGGDGYWTAFKSVVGSKGIYVTAVGNQEHNGEHPISMVQALGFGLSLANRKAAGFLGLCAGYHMILNLPKPRLAALGDMVADGRVKSIIDREYPLTEVREALLHQASHRARGKILIRVRAPAAGGAPGPRA